MSSAFINSDLCSTFLTLFSTTFPYHTYFSAIKLLFLLIVNFYNCQMSNFLKKFVSRPKSKSRSKSPVKYPVNTADHEFEHWRMSRPRHKVPPTMVYQNPPDEPIYASDINPFTAQYGGFSIEVRVEYFS